MSKKVWLALPSSLEPKLKSIKKLSALGLNKSQISREVGASINIYSKYKKCNDAFLDGKAQLAREVAESFKNNMAYSHQDRAHISKHLRLYDMGVEVPEIVDISTAREALGLVTRAYALGECSTETAEQTRKMVVSFTDSILNTQIEERLTRIEEHFAGKEEVV